MKKLRIVALIVIACSIFFVGCSKSENLKLTSTDLSIANFYQNAGHISASSIDIGENTTQEQQEHIMSMALIALPLEMSKEFEVCLISAMDYCMEIVDGVSIVLERIFEYDEAIIIVSKAKTQSIFTANYYTKNNMEEIAEILKNEPLYTYSIKISPNKVTGVYEFNESTTKNSGSVYYNKQFGTLKISYKFNVQTNVQYKYERNFYKYAGQAHVLREIVEVATESGSEKIIKETLIKSFFAKLKVGVLKDSNSLVGLENVAEPDIAKDTADADLFGYIMTIDLTSGRVTGAGETGESFVPNVNIRKYGIFPQEGA